MELCDELKFWVVVFNFCLDYMYILLVCWMDEILKIMYCIKGRIVKLCNEYWVYMCFKGINFFGGLLYKDGLILFWL